MRNSSATLTLKQLRWIDEYLVDMNAAAAAVRAGYSERSARSIACELLTKHDIQAVLKARQAAMAKELQLTRQGVIQGLLEAVNIGREQQNSGAMVTALREIAKMLGFYEPEVTRAMMTSEQNHTNNSMAALTDGELADLINRRAAAS